MRGNVLVIGNGFDIAHGLPTKYENFIQYIKNFIKEHKGKNLIGSTNIEFMRIIETNGFIKFFIEYENEIPGWVDCEQMIRYVTRQVGNFVEDYTLYLSSRRDVSKRLTPYEQKNVLLKFDLFNEEVSNSALLEFKSIYYSKIYGLNEREFLKFFKKQLDDLTRALQIYLCEVIKESSELTAKGQIEAINPSYVITFNYTDIYKIYDIDVSNVFHVHGSIEKDNMVLGYNDDEPENLKFVYFKKYFQRIQKLTGYIDEHKLRVNNKGIPESANVHFYGHSMDKTDGDIILKLASSANSFIIYTYNQEDFEQKVINLIDIFGKERATNMIQSGFIKFVPCE